MSGGVIMVQGTASWVGKSILTTGLCRLLRRRGLRVAPFKSQNMALNSFVTPDGGEIGRAQAVQADACGVPPTVAMNPVLLKPDGDARSQVVVMGKPVGSMTAVEYHAYKPALMGIIDDCLGSLRGAYDVVVIEGAGSPAEINLRDRDIVNMAVARAAEAPVLLAGDIDRGGVFAALVGTMELLEPADRERVAGFVINKFRGDASLLDSGLRFLEQRTGVPVLGVVPYIRDLRIAEEDSLGLDARGARRAAELQVAAIRLPRISNYDDLDPLDAEPGVSVAFTADPAVVAAADLVVLPGTKSTMADLAWLRHSGLAAAIERRAAAGGMVLGICGGCQILGRAIRDPHGVESEVQEAMGLGLLPLDTEFARDKRTAQIRGHVRADVDVALHGYEIHMGRVHSERPFAAIRERNGQPCDEPDGAVDGRGTVVGTMIHGLFENDGYRSALVRSLRSARGLSTAAQDTRWSRDGEYDRVAQTLEDSLDVERVLRLIGVKSSNLD